MIRYAILEGGKVYLIEHLTEKRTHIQDAFIIGLSGKGDTDGVLITEGTYNVFICKDPARGVEQALDTVTKAISNLVNLLKSEFSAIQGGINSAAGDTPNGYTPTPIDQNMKASIDAATKGSQSVGCSPNTPITPNKIDPGLGNQSIQELSTMVYNQQKTAAELSEQLHQKLSGVATSLFGEKDASVDEAKSKKEVQDRFVSQIQSIKDDLKNYTNYVTEESLFNNQF